MLQIVKQSKYLEQPNHNKDHHNDVKDGFEGSLHRNIGVHKPENYSGHNEDDEDSDNRHKNKIKISAEYYCEKVTLFYPDSIT